MRENMSEIKEYSLDLQKLFVQFMITDPELYSRVRSIIRPEYFDRGIRKVVDTIISHTEEYSTVPTTDIIKAQAGQEIALSESNPQMLHSNMTRPN